MLGAKLCKIRFEVGRDLDTYLAKFLDAKTRRL